MPKKDFSHRDLIMLSAAPRPIARVGWIFELKYDGFCVMARTRSMSSMRSRQGREMARAFPELVEELAKPPDLVLDGELVITV